MMILGNFSREVHLLEPHDSMLRVHTRLEFHSLTEVLDFLPRSVEDEFQRRLLRETLARLEWQVYQLTDEEVLRHIALHVVSGALRVVVRDYPYHHLARASGGGSGAMSGGGLTAREQKRPPVKVESPPLPPMVKTQLTWVEIELVDMAGKPVPHARYRIELPDGQFQEGTLARADEIEPGTCWISFPDYDKDSLSRA